MLIEIKDLPQGRKVKRILVDITFEESGGYNETAGTDGHEKPEIPEISEISGKQKEVQVPMIQNGQESQGSQGSPEGSEIPKVEFDKRPPMEIPDEMLNLEL